MSTGQLIDLYARTTTEDLMSEREMRDERRRDPRSHRPKWQRKLARKAREESVVMSALRRHRRRAARAEKRGQKPRRGTCRDNAGTQSGRQYRGGRHKSRAKLAQAAA